MTQKCNNLRRVPSFETKGTTQTGEQMAKHETRRRELLRMMHVNTLAVLSSCRPVMRRNSHPIPLLSLPLQKTCAASLGQYLICIEGFNSSAIGRFETMHRPAIRVDPDRAPGFSIARQRARVMRQGRKRMQAYIERNARRFPQR